MELEPGSIVEAKVTGITKFGAFVSLPEGKSGLVHISELANTYVSDVSEHVSVGDTVRVFVLGATAEGKINLSIKRALPRPEHSAPPKPRCEQKAKIEPEDNIQPKESRTSGNDSFEDKLKKFMRESDSRIADNRMYSEHRQRSRRR